MNYYNQFFKHCARRMDTSCTLAVLEKLGIKDDVEDCYYKSVVDKSGTTQLQRNIYLNDNSVLSEAKKEFSKIENFNRFPLLKINDMIYYGPLDIDNVFGFVCKHVRSDLTGCRAYVTFLGGGDHSRFFTIVVIMIVSLMIFILLNMCRKRLRLKFENELNYQVDASINKFLEKTGGDGL